MQISYRITRVLRTRTAGLPLLAVSRQRRLLHSAPGAGLPDRREKPSMKKTRSRTTLSAPPSAWRPTPRSVRCSQVTHATGPVTAEPPRSFREAPDRAERHLWLCRSASRAKPDGLGRSKKKFSVSALRPCTRDESQPSRPSSRTFISWGGAARRPHWRCSDTPFAPARGGCVRESLGGIQRLFRRA